MIIGLIVLAVIVVLYFLGIVGLLSILGAIFILIGSFGALVYDEIDERLHRAGFIIVTIFGIILIVGDLIYW